MQWCRKKQQIVFSDLILLHFIGLIIRTEHEHDETECTTEESALVETAAEQMTHLFPVWANKSLSFLCFQLLGLSGAVKGAHLKWKGNSLRGKDFRSPHLSIDAKQTKRYMYIFVSCKCSKYIVGVSLSIIFQLLNMLSFYNSHMSSVAIRLLWFL